jgi:hypothetical protein
MEITELLSYCAMASAFSPAKDLSQSQDLRVSTPYARECFHETALLPHRATSDDHLSEDKELP